MHSDKINISFSQFSSICKAQALLTPWCTSWNHCCELDLCEKWKEFSCADIKEENSNSSPSGPTTGNKSKPADITPNCNTCDCLLSCGISDKVKYCSNYTPA